MSIFKRKIAYKYRVDSLIFLDTLELEDQINAITNEKLLDGSSWRLVSATIKTTDEAYPSAIIICERETV